MKGCDIFAECTVAVVTWFREQQSCSHAVFIGLSPQLLVPALFPAADQPGHCLPSPAAATAGGKPLLYHCAAEETSPKDLTQGKPSHRSGKMRKRSKSCMNFSKQNENAKIFPFLFSQFREFSMQEGSLVWRCLSRPRFTPRKIKVTKQK